VAYGDFFKETLEVFWAGGGDLDGLDDKPGCDDLF